MPRFAGRLFISKSLPYFLEFAHPDVSKGSGLAFVAERLGFRRGGDGRVRRRGERPRAARLGRLRRRRRERARGRARARRSRRSLGAGGRRGCPAGELPRLRRVIDARAARAEPDEYRRRLARKGAAEAFDAWLAADARWRELVPRVDELRSRTKVKGKPTPEQLEELRGVKEELQQVERELDRGGGCARRGACAGAESAATTRLRTAATEEDAEVAPRRGRAGAARRAEGAHRDRPLRHGARGAPLRLPVRLPDRRHGAARACALPLRARHRGEARPHADAAAGARPRGRDVRHRLLPDGALEHLRARGGRAVPDRYLRGRPRRPAHGRDPRGAAAPLLGLLDELPARGRRRGQGHARHVPRPSVQQGRALRLHATPRSRATRTNDSLRSRRRSSRRSAFRTASSTSRPATLAPRRRRSTTSRAGSRSRSAIAS